MPSYNLADLFEQVVDVVPERVAMIAEGKHYGYRELDQRANRLAGPPRLYPHGLLQG